MRGKSDRGRPCRTLLGLWLLDAGEGSCQKALERFSVRQNILPAVAKSCERQ